MKWVSNYILLNSSTIPSYYIPGGGQSCLQTGRVGVGSLYKTFGIPANCFTIAPLPQNPVPSSVEAHRNIGDWRPRRKTCIIIWVLLKFTLKCGRWIIWKQPCTVWYPSLELASTAFSTFFNYVYHLSHVRYIGMVPLMLQPYWVHIRGQRSCCLSRILVLCKQDTSSTLGPCDFWWKTYVSYVRHIMSLASDFFWLKLVVHYPQTSPITGK